MIEMKKILPLASIAIIALFNYPAWGSSIYDKLCQRENAHLVKTFSKSGKVFQTCGKNIVRTDNWTGIFISDENYFLMFKEQTLPRQSCIMLLSAYGSNFLLPDNQIASMTFENKIDCAQRTAKKISLKAYSAPFAEGGLKMESTLNESVESPELLVDIFCSK